MTKPSALLEVRNLRVGFARRHEKSKFWGLDDVSLELRRGSTLGIVGESGSGKTTLARAVLGLVPVDSGHITLDGRPVGVSRRGAERRRLATRVQAVFQDPSGSLNPSFTVGKSLAEPLLAQGRVRKDELAAVVAAALQRVGLEPSAAAMLPRQFSGGQQQRICIARALMTSPSLVICDEAVSALDLSVQAQVLNLLGDLQKGLGLSYLFISHDMNVVRRVCHDVMVIYRGQVMEQGPAASVMFQPAHPYTRELILSAPIADPVLQAQRRERHLAGPTGPASLEGLRGDTGCAFVSRCPFAVATCQEERPALKATADGRLVACHRFPEWRLHDTSYPGRLSRDAAASQSTA